MSEGASLKLQLELTPVGVPSGELRTAGLYVHQLVLDGPPTCAVLIEKPSAVVRLPVRDYKTCPALLAAWRNLGSGAIRPRYFRLKCSRWHLAGRRTAHELGWDNPDGQAGALQMDQMGVGWGGKSHKLVLPDTRNEPEFAIYRGDQRIATGKGRAATALGAGLTIPFGTVAFGLTTAGLAVDAGILIYSASRDSAPDLHSALQCSFAGNRQS